MHRVFPTRFRFGLVLPNILDWTDDENKHGFILCFAEVKAGNLGD